MWRATSLLCGAVNGGLVSMRFAPSFEQPPAAKVIGVSLKKIPARWVTAYVEPDVITVTEEAALLKVVEPWFQRLPYNDGHVDDLIHHYKEFYRSHAALLDALGDTAAAASTDAAGCGRGSTDVPLLADGVSDAERAAARAALTRAHNLAVSYLPHVAIDDRVHFLRLAGSGFIRAHVDETRNSSGLIGGLCLRSARVMTLTRPDFPTERVELLLAPRCFYAILGTARYHWAHGVDWTADDGEHVGRVCKSVAVDDTAVTFDGHTTKYRRGERTAIIFRGVSPMQLLMQRARDAPR